MSRPILFVGDIHLGRRPSGLEDVLPVLGLEPRQLSTAAAWEVTVARAVQRDVRALVLAGDVVEGLRDRFEAYVHLHRGISELVKAGIPVFAVAGNHDVEALPLLAERIPEVTLVGRDGRWEIVEIPGRDDEPPVDLLGWSFPSETVREDPTANAGFQEALASRRAGARLVGIVHGDLDAPGSRYAPLSRHRLAAAPVEGWFLGHIHKPGPLDGPRPIGYLGSLAALDPGETGVHGPWELHLDGGLELHQIPLSPIRFENEDLPVEDLEGETEDALLASLGRTIRGRFAEDLETARDHLLLLAVRVTLKGHARNASAVDTLVRLTPRDRIFPGDGPPIVVTRLTDRTLPPMDLEELARAPDPAGELAQTILALEGEPPPELIEAAEKLLAPWKDARWTGGEIPDPPATRELLAAAARRALRAVLEHRVTGGEG